MPVVEQHDTIEEHTGSRLTRWWIVSALLILILALGLRLHGISSESVGGDETGSFRIALSETARGLETAEQDLVHPPLYYLLLKATLPASRPVSAMDGRVLSLAAAEGFILVTMLLGLVVPPLRNAALFAGLLIALNQLHIYYSQEVRSYSLFCLLAGGLLIWALVIDRYAQKPVFWLTGAAIMTILLYTHYFGAFYCAAVVLSVMVGRYPGLVKMRVVAISALAGVLFLPWILVEIPVYRAKSGLGADLAGQGVASWFNLKAFFAQYLGIPDFPGASTLAFLIGGVLVCCALLPRSRREGAVLDSKSGVLFLSAAAMPPLLAFFSARPPFNINLFSERHLLPSILPVLVLACYGLWRMAARTSKPAVVCMLGGAVLILLQALPLWSHWPGPARHPNAAIAEWLTRHDPNYPVYTTWPYGIGEPVMFYLRGSKFIYRLPGTPLLTHDVELSQQPSIASLIQHPGSAAPPQSVFAAAAPANLPDKFIVLYRPAAAHENAVVQPLLNQFGRAEEQCYSALNSRWGTCGLVLQKFK